MEHFKIYIFKLIKFKLKFGPRRLLLNDYGQLPHPQIAVRVTKKSSLENYWLSDGATFETNVVPSFRNTKI